ncbi:MAG: helix-turn-helix domain-containing protein [Clostridiales bacterium]|nr:helix-turn-helix domain-containing protein [Clostridiales bacterium]MDY2657764.1 helix-turn-helix transcriptional regulator [Candidatus Limiplasma sp.]
MDYVDLGRRVRKQRQLIGLTQQELAERIGVSTSFVGHVERGTRKASLETLVALSNALGVGVDYLLAGSLQNAPDEENPSAAMDPNRRMVIREILSTLQEHLSDWGPDK